VLVLYNLLLFAILLELATSSYCRHVDESATGLCTVSIEQVVDRAEAAAVDHYLSSPV